MMKRLDNQQLDDIRLILRDLLKVIKVVSMYPENNPLPQSLKRTFAEKLAEIVRGCGTLEIDILKERLQVGRNAVFTDHSREERLAGMFFDTGITQIVFKEGLDESAVYRFLEAIKTYLNTAREGGDLAALLWEANITAFAFRTIEDVALADYDGDFRVQEVFQPGRLVGEEQAPHAKPYEAMFDDSQAMRLDDDSGIFVNDDESDPYIGANRVISLDESGPIQIMPEGYQPGPGPIGSPGIGSSFDPGAGSAQSIVGSIFDGADQGENNNLKINQAVEAMGLGDLTDKAPRLPAPDTALILNDEHRLSEEEEEEIRRILMDDATFSVYESTSELLKELLHQETELAGFNETVTICEKVNSEFIKAGKITYATEVMRYFKQIEEQIRGDKPQWSSRLREAVITAGSRERLGLLARALNEHNEIGTVEIRGYLDLFGWEALMGITETVGQLQHELHRNAVGDYLAQKGQGNMATVAKGIYDSRPEVVTSAVSVLVRIGDDQALGYLKKVVKHKDAAIRRLLVGHLQDCANDSAIHLLKQLAVDSDADTRRSAVKALVARRGVAAFDAVADLISGEDFKTIDSDDQRTLLIAYSVLGGDMAVEKLCEFASQMSLFGGSEQSAMQHMAFEALAHNRGQKSEKTLVKLASSWRPKLKEMAAEALRERRRLLYGGTGDDGTGVFDDMSDFEGDEDGAE